MLAAPMRWRPPVVCDALEEALRQAGKPMALRELAHHAQVGLAAADRALRNARQANGTRPARIQVVGHEKQAHCTKWVALYDLAPGETEREAAPVVLALNELGELIATHWRSG